MDFNGLARWPEPARVRLVTLKRLLRVPDGSETCHGVHTTAAEIATGPQRAYLFIFAPESS